MDEAKATAVLRRFDDITRIIAGSLAETFSRVTEREDAEQDARLLVLSYAGLVPSQYGLGHVGKLMDIEREAQGDELRTKRLLAQQLKMDLTRHYGRQLDKIEPTDSLETLPVNRHPTYTFEDAVLSHLDVDQTRLDFPYLTAHHIDGLSVVDIANAEGVHRNTIFTRLAKERDVFLTNYLTSRGLRVEGDETAEELLEAYGHLKASGR